MVRSVALAAAVAAASFTAVATSPAFVGTLAVLADGGTHAVHFDLVGVTLAVLTVRTGGSITQSAALNVTDLAGLHATGSVTLENAANNFATLDLTAAAVVAGVVAVKVALPPGERSTASSRWEEILRTSTSGRAPSCTSTRTTTVYAPMSASGAVASSRCGPPPRRNDAPCWPGCGITSSASTAPGNRVVGVTATDITRRDRPCGAASRLCGLPARRRRHPFPPPPSLRSRYSPFGGGETRRRYATAPWHFLYLRPLPQGQGWFRPTFPSAEAWRRTGAPPEAARRTAGSGREGCSTIWAWNR